MSNALREIAHNRTYTGAGNFPFLHFDHILIYLIVGLGMLWSKAVCSQPVVMTVYMQLIDLGESQNVMSLHDEQCDSSFASWIVECSFGLMNSEQWYFDFSLMNI